VEGDAAEGGEIAEITLMIRPLAQLQAAVAMMARALAEPGRRGGGGARAQRRH
jgi:hypothetical protein